MDDVDRLAVPVKGDALVEGEHGQRRGRPLALDEHDTPLAAFHEALADTAVRNDRRLLAERRVAAGVVEVIVGVDHERDLAVLDLGDRRFDPGRDGHHRVIDEEDAVFARRDREIPCPRRIGDEQVDPLAERGGPDLDIRKVRRGSRRGNRAHGQPGAHHPHSNPHIVVSSAAHESDDWGCGFPPVTLFDGRRVDWRKTPAQSSDSPGRRPVLPRVCPPARGSICPGRGNARWPKPHYQIGRQPWKDQDPSWAESGFS